MRVRRPYVLDRGGEWVCIRYPDTAWADVYAIGDKRSCDCWATVLRNAGEQAVVMPTAEVER